jgi:two-component system cell cycle sensor histidine kinase/response regulator CckA
MIKPCQHSQSAASTELTKVQTLEQMGLVVATIAHDFNNVLATIVGNVELLMSDQQPESVPYNQLEEIANAAQYAIYLNRQLMGWSNQQLPATSLDLNETIAEVVQMSRSLITSNITLQLDLNQDLPSMIVNPTQMRRMVWNLLHNAIEACSQSPGEILIRTDQVQLELQDLATMDLGSDCEAGSYLTLEVRDSGRGMDELLQTRIFDPFFTTKTAGHGLGLLVVSETIGLYHGALKLESTIGEGSRFLLYFPVS